MRVGALVVLQRHLSHSIFYIYTQRMKGDSVTSVIRSSTAAGLWQYNGATGWRGRMQLCLGKP